jgi:hypothetical protein
MDLRLEPRDLVNENVEEQDDIPETEIGQEAEWVPQVKQPGIPKPEIGQDPEWQIVCVQEGRGKHLHQRSIGRTVSLRVVMRSRRSSRKVFRSCSASSMAAVSAFFARLRDWVGVRVGWGL